MKLVLNSVLNMRTIFYYTSSDGRTVTRVTNCSLIEKAETLRLIVAFNFVTADRFLDHILQD